MLNIRKAVPEELDGIFEIFVRATEHMNAIEIHQWDEVYPNRETLRDDIERLQLYVAAEGDALRGAFVLNCECHEEYDKGDWADTTRNFLVLHRLCVDPLAQSKGIATEIMKHIEIIAKDSGTASIRLDAFPQNPYAVRLYEKLGYRKAGTVNFRKGLFFLYEKCLPDECAAV